MRPYIIQICQRRTKIYYENSISFFTSFVTGNAKSEEQVFLKIVKDNTEKISNSRRASSRSRRRWVEKISHLLVQIEHSLQQYFFAACKFHTRRVSSIIFIFGEFENKRRSIYWFIGTCFTSPRMCLGTIH